MITELWHFFLWGGWVQCWALKNTVHACEIWVLRVHILWSPFLLLENRMMTFVFSATPFKVDMESNPKMDPWNRSVFVSFGLFSHCTAPQHEPAGSHFFWVPNMVILTKCPKRSWQTWVQICWFMTFCDCFFWVDFSFDKCEITLCKKKQP